VLLLKQVRMLDDDIPLAQYAVAFEGASWKDPDSIPLMVMQAILGSWNKTAGGGKHMGYVTWTPLPEKGKILSLILTECILTINSSELAQRIGINEVAESIMAFNTNYKDTGLFGVYAVAKVRLSVVFLIEVFLKTR